MSTLVMHCITYSIEAYDGKSLYKKCMINIMNYFHVDDNVFAVKIDFVTDRNAIVHQTGITQIKRKCIKENIHVNQYSSYSINDDNLLYIMKCSEPTSTDIS